MVFYSRGKLLVGDAFFDCLEFCILKPKAAPFSFPELVELAGVLGSWSRPLQTTSWLVDGFQIVCADLNHASVNVPVDRGSWNFAMAIGKTLGFNRLALNGFVLATCD